MHQEKKLLRAEKARSIAARTLKQLTAASSGAGPSSEEYERDMDLRAEKEAQRAALIRLREIAIADVNFSAACRLLSDYPLGFVTIQLQQQQYQ